MKSWQRDTIQNSREVNLLRIPASLHFLLPNELKNDHLVRIGNKRDGGYVLPSLVVRDSKSLISFGLGADFSFEKEISNLNHSIPVVVYDHSVSLLISSKNLISGMIHAPILRTLSDIRLRLSAIYHPASFISKYILFFKIRSHNRHIREKVVQTAITKREASIANIMADCRPEALVKIDIEGGEYDIFSTVLDNASKIICLVVEFHDVCARQSDFRILLDRTLEHFALVHVHVNNASKAINGVPDILELTFVEKPRALDQKIQYDLPIIGLDFPNLIHQSDFRLTFS